MHVGLDARMIGHSGIGVYLAELIAALTDIEPGLQMTLFGDPERLAGRGGPAARAVSFRAPLYGLRERRGWPPESRECDVLFAPHYAAPGRPPRPLVVTVHDLIHFLGPGELRGPRRWWATRILRPTLGAARAVICDSEATRRDLQEVCPETAAKPVHVIPLAPSPRFLGPPVPAEEAAWRRAAGLPERYWLGIGIDKPHKRWPFAAGLVSAESAPLILVGAGEERAAARVRVMRWVEPERLPALCRGAVGLLFPSVREGFGLPAVEAMAAGCPVLAARAGSLTEVVGDGGVLLPPEDAPVWREAMRRVETDAAWREALIARGKAWVARFSWPQTARRTLDILRSALS